MAEPLERVWHANLRYFREFTRRGGGEVHESDGVLVWVGVHPLAFLINAAVRIDPAVPAAAVLDAAASVFGNRGHEIVTLGGADDDIADAAKRAGYRIGDPDPLQFLSGPLVEQLAESGGLVIRRVDDASGVADVARINSDATTLYGFPEDLFPAIFARPGTVLADDMIAVVAYQDDRPVATAQVMLAEATAYVGWVAVVADQMRRGLGRLVTADVVRAGFDAGADAAVLLASPMGAPVYRRMGFSDVGHARGCTSASRGKATVSDPAAIPKRSAS